ncbi:MAG: divergent polysaccharide deacetylase family protein [Elstera sp.]
MTSMTDPRGSPQNRGGGILAAAWLLVIALFAGMGAWVFAVTRGVDAPPPAQSVAAATLALPAAKPQPTPTAQTAPSVAQTAPAVAPSSPVAAKPPVVAAKPDPAPVLQSPTVIPPPERLALPGQPLAAVEPGLLRDSPYGPIPRLSADRKRAPWQVYAAPFDAPDAKPRLSVVVTGLGLARDVTERAIATLPPQISLSFSPYAAETPNAVAAARQRGHEVLLDLALEPESYPRIDPGPATLVGAYSGADNVARLDWVLARAQGTIGVVAQYGPSFGASAMAMAPIAQALRERGLMYVDNQASEHPAMMRLSRDFAVPWAFANAAFDPGSADEAATLVATLHQLEKASTVQRAMLALVPVSPVAIQTIAAWAKTVEPRGFALAPVSGIASRQDERDVGRK